MPTPDVTPESFLAMRTAMLAGTAVNAVAYSTAKGSFPQVSHRTGRGELYDPDRMPDGRYNAVPRLLRRGTDPLEAVTAFCHEHDMEAFWSLRMNDGHDDYYHLAQGRPLSAWKASHPECLLGGDGWQPGQRRSWRLNYAVDAVPDFVFELVKEVCENYDVDGVELDFLRDPILFRSHWCGETPGRDERMRLTGLLKRIRWMADGIGTRRGRPVLILIRVPDSIDYCRQCGIDVESWLRNALVDVLIAGGRILLNPWKCSVELGQRWAVPVWAGISDCVMRNAPACARRQTLEAYRARAAQAWAAGAAGIYLFNPFIPGLSDAAQARDGRRSNSFEPGHPLWREISGLEVLRGLEKHYYASFIGPPAAGKWGPAHCVSNADRFMNLPSLCPDAPLRIEPGCRDFTIVEVPESLARVGATLRIQTKGVDTPAALEVCFNGKTLSGGVFRDGWLQYRVPVRRIQRGANQVDLVAAGGSAVEVTDLMVRVRSCETRNTDASEASG